MLKFNSHFHILHHISNVIKFWQNLIQTINISQSSLIGPRQENLVLIAYASSEGSGEPAQSRQNLRCSLIQTVSQEEPSDRKPDPWPLWMAGHAQVKFVMTECSKTQICLTRHNLFHVFDSRNCCWWTSLQTFVLILQSAVAVNRVISGNTRHCSCTESNVNLQSQLLWHYHSSQHDLELFWDVTF